MSARMYLYKRIVYAKLFIDDHFATDIDLDKISDHAHFSKFHFLRLFKSAFGTSPHQYLIGVRLSQSKQLLLAGKSVAEVCLEVGFQSMPSFSTLFKKRFGLTPTEFVAREHDLEARICQEPFAFVPNCFAENYGWRK